MFKPTKRNTRLSMDAELEGLLKGEPFMILENQTFSRKQLVLAAHTLGLQLPENPFVINLYTQRHHFLVLLLAVAMRSGVSVLPPSMAPNALNGLVKDLGTTHERLVVGDVDTAETTHTFDIDKFLNNPVKMDDVDLRQRLRPVLSAEIWIYTSGSSGYPKKVIKNWLQMRLLASQAIERFSLNKRSFLVATVPCQHMYGLETSVFWPLFSDACVAVSRPFYPEDIQAAIQKQPQMNPILVSTPLHLSKLIQFDTQWNDSNLCVLSATAPLTLELAQNISKRLFAQVFEVFGSTETASFASREVLKSPIWQLYSHNRLKMRPKDEGLSCYIEMALLNETAMLQDQIVQHSDASFEFVARQSDLIKVAGKRQSLQTLNRLLNNIEGVTEGLFVQDEESGRLWVFMVGSVSAHDLKSALLSSIDAVFVPRKVVYLETIPRNELGKLQMSALKAMMLASESTRKD